MDFHVNHMNISRQVPVKTQDKDDAYIEIRDAVWRLIFDSSAKQAVLLVKSRTYLNF